MTEKHFEQLPVVLFVDDDADFLSSVKTEVAQLGVNSITCSSIVEASRVISSTPSDYDAIVVDVNFSSEGEDAGIRLLETISADFGAKAPHLFVLTDSALTPEQSARLSQMRAKVFDKGALKVSLFPIPGFRWLPRIDPGASSSSDKVESLLSRSEVEAKAKSSRAAENYHSCFISYADQDRPFAERLYEDLLGTGVRCWFAPRSMAIGALMRPTIDRAISEHERFLLVLSDASVASHWVRDEVEKAFERERQERTTIVIPIAVDDAVFRTNEGWACSLKNTRNIGDFRDRDQQAFHGSLERLKAALRR